MSLLRHRGPDDQGVLLSDGKCVIVGRDLPTREWTGEAVFLHQRLSILDLSEAGWQPMASEDGRYYIIFNGEIYNFVELRRELEGLGFTFRSRSDTEVLLAAYLQWGAKVLSRLVGMFAFAVFDSVARRLFLARDPFGIKPLYYVCGPVTFAFASEIKALLALEWVPRTANPGRVYDYLRFGVTDHGSETMLAAISCLPAAHFLEISVAQPERVRPIRYWDIDLENRSVLSMEGAAEQLRALFLESMRFHLRSDVPLGAALSGGVDSSAIVMAMREVGGAGLDLKTFTFVPNDPLLSEKSFVAEIADRAGTEAHYVTPDAGDIVDDIESVIVAQDEPFTSTSIYAQYRVFRLAHKAGIKVMLDGQGADELLGGYRHYLGPRLGSLLRQGRLRAAVGFLARAGRLPGGSKRAILMGAGAGFLPGALHGQMRRLVGKDLLPSWLSRDWVETHRIAGEPLNYTVRGKETLRRTLYRSLTGVGLPALLRYEDRNSMAFSIESRVPFLTSTIANFLLSLPEEYLIDERGVSKRVFRDAMRGLVPDLVLDRRDKIGFATPEREWLLALGPWVDAALSIEALSGVPALDGKAVRGQWREIAEGRRRFDSRVWRWCNLIVWSRKMRIGYA